MKPGSFIILVFSAALVSCTPSHKVTLPNDYSHVYTKEGRIDTFEPDPSKNKFILYARQKNTLKPCLSELWTSSADSVFKANQEWQFMIIYNGSLADSLDLRNLLERYECGAYLVISENDEFKDKNGLDNVFLTSYFLDRRNKVLGQWLVGDDSFEKQFNRVKNNIQ